MMARCRHRALIGACVSALSERMDDVAASTEWETEWLSLDREQLVEFIRSSELTVKDEWDLWQVRMRYVTQSMTVADQWHAVGLTALSADLKAIK